MTSTLFTIDNGTLTPTLKIKRNEAKKMYEEILNAMYVDLMKEEKKETG